MLVNKPAEMRRDLRRSFRCGCGPERFDLDPLRVVQASGDFGEDVLADCEAASGERPIGCPWSALADPFVREVIAAHRSWSKGALEARYAGHVPQAIMIGVEQYDAALNAVQCHDMREDREEREREAARRRTEHQANQR